VSPAILRQPNKRSKYRAVPTVVDSIRFASKKEAKRYGELKALERAGEIRNLELQFRFALYGANGIVVGHYVADFVYDAGCKTIIEDVKGGIKTQVYKLKKKLLECQGYKILEI